MSARLKPDEPQGLLVEHPTFGAAHFVREVARGLELEVFRSPWRRRRIVASERDVPSLRSCEQTRIVVDRDEHWSAGGVISLDPDHIAPWLEAAAKTAQRALSLSATPSPRDATALLRLLRLIDLARYEDVALEVFESRRLAHQEESGVDIRGARVDASGALLRQRARRVAELFPRDDDVRDLAVSIQAAIVREDCAARLALLSRSCGRTGRGVTESILRHASEAARRAGAGLVSAIVIAKRTSSMPWGTGIGGAHQQLTTLVAELRLLAVRGAGLFRRARPMARLQSLGA